MFVKSQHSSRPDRVGLMTRFSASGVRIIGPWRGIESLLQVCLNQRQGMLQGVFFTAGKPQNARNCMKTSNPGSLLLPVPSRADLDVFNGVTERAVLIQIASKFLVANCFRRLSSQRAVGLQALDFFQKTLFHHQAHPSVDSSVEFRGFPVEAGDDRGAAGRDDRVSPLGLPT